MKSNLTYQQSGVNIDAGNAFVKTIQSLIQKRDPRVISGIGGFAAVYDLTNHSYAHPYLVSSTDGVGTKLKLAMEMGKHDTIGIDCVAMCVNDVLTTGADPLFFLDYYATGCLNPSIATEVLKGITMGCELANITLIGGETAEMPGMYHGEDYDIAGFAIGLVDKKDLIKPHERIQPGDICLAIASSGPHSNGYSLIRKILELTETDLGLPFDGATLGEKLLAPTRIYTTLIQTLKKSIPLHGIAHITGGGITDNLPRILPTHCAAELPSWTKPPIFEWLQSRGNIAEEEMLRTFNCGIGLVLVVPPSAKEQTLDECSRLGEQAFELGTITPRASHTPYVTVY